MSTTTPSFLARLLARILLSITCFQLAVGVQIAAAASPPVSAAPTVAPVPANTGTTIGKSANGTPVVNIATPNSAGVSHNVYNSYDVGSAGLILNNSAANAVSIIGGGTVANPNLAAGQAASLILNEVTSANPSTLAGYQEILGPSAELVIANPYGITCNGCGFINTPRVTLTTGVPSLSPNGALAGFTITGGQLAIGANGIDASRQSILDLLARSVSVAGNVVVGSQADKISGDLQVIGGASRFDYATRTATSMAGSGAAPQFAIDSSVLGGMYADRIRLLVNEHGAGVRTAGNLAALADDLDINADGNIELQGATSAARDINVQGAGVQVHLPNSGTYVYAGRNLNVNSAGDVDLGTGSIGAQGNVSLSAAGSLTDSGGANDLRFTGGGPLIAMATGALDLSGGYWTAPQLSFDGASVQLGPSATLYGSGGSAVNVTTPGALSITGGKVYSSGDAALSANRIEVDPAGVVAATGALSGTVGRGSSGGVDNAGTLQGDSVNLVATGDAPSTATTFHNAATGAILASKSLSVSESGPTSPAGSQLANDGSMAADTVTIGTADTANTGAIQATTSLDLHSATLENTGSSATIVGSTDPTGTATIESGSITNSGTIWSGGDLSLAPTTLTQQRAAGATSNPLIGAGRDLTIAYTGAADLGTGDLQAGRDLTLTATSIVDRARAAAGATAGDLRYAGRNLTATATQGSVSLAGGQWYSVGDLRLTGDSINLGEYLDPTTGTITQAPGLQVVGAQGGSGVVALTARAGNVAVLDDAEVLSGGDLSVAQPSGFVLDQGDLLQATGTLSIAAGTQIENAGTIAGSIVSLASNDATPLSFTDDSTGIVYGSHGVQIGTAANPAGLILLQAPASNNDGIFGGVLSLYAGDLANYGTIEGAGTGSLISVGDLENQPTGRILGFADANGDGGTTIDATSLTNSGFLYDSSSLSLNTGNFENTATGTIGSAGQLTLVNGTPANPIAADNQGQIWGGTLDLTFATGLQNGRDPGNPANRGNTASIYAAGDLTITNLNAQTITNNDTIESGGNMFVDLGGGTLLNTMSMVPDSELVWITDNSNPVNTSGDLGFVTTGANKSSDKQSVTIAGTTYYWFNQIGGSTQAYEDGQQTNVQNQQFANGFSPSSVPIPTIRAGGNMEIYDFQNLSNVGTISGVGDVNLIGAAGTTSSVDNSSLKFGQRDIVSQRTNTYTCRFNTGVTDLATSCGASPNDITFDSTYQTNTLYTARVPGNDAFTGKILAGGQLNIYATTTVNGTTGKASAVTVSLPGAGTSPTSPISITQAGTTNARSGTAINVNGAQVTLPTSPNGRFVQAQGSATAPLIETNPLFGIDSLALGSDYLTKLLGLNPDQEGQRLGDSNYEDYLIQQQVEALSGRSVLEGYGAGVDMDKALFDNAATQAKALNLGYGQALTADQVASLTSDIVWLVQEVVQGKKVLVPVVYLANATRASLNVGSGPTLSGADVNIHGSTVKNIGGDILAQNAVNISTSGDIKNLSGNISGWNVVLDAGGDVVNSTLVSRIGDATNGIDVAQRTASIQAGNTAVLHAAHDVTVNGGWVSAAKDAALIAGNDVNVQSEVLTTNSHSQAFGNYQTSQTQTAQIGGVSAGGNAVMQAGRDVNLKGASVSAGGTALLDAQRGNVNVGVLELKNSSISSTTSNEMYADTNTDKSSASIGIGFGYEQKTTTHSDSSTTGLGSAVSGNTVAIITGKGNVNIAGSSITAGAGGAVIDSARDVNIKAYNSTSTTTDSTDKVRAGYQFDASADGAYAGAKESGDNSTVSTVNSQAQTSSIASGGDINILGNGTITNEGTSLDAAGNVVLDAQNVINKAVHDTVTTTTSDTSWETKQQVGLTTNGTGASINDAVQGKGDQVTVGTPELEERDTFSYDNDTNSQSQSTSHGTKINAGGSVVVVAQNHARDEGTQYNAGKDVVISAADYENKAAKDTTSSTDENTSASGEASVGVDATASVDVDASAQGSHTTSGTKQSTAKTGAINAGGSVIIQASKGDVTLEGTNVNGAKGVGITAARDININQANDTTESTSAEQSGSGQASVSVSLVGAGAAVGLGASTRLANSDDTTSTAKAASIKSGNGNVQLQAGGNLTSQGANIAAAGNVALKAGGDINLLAATDHNDKTGSVQAGGANVNVGFGTGEAEGSGSLGANVNFENGSTDYHETTQHGSSIQAGGNFSLDAGGNAHLQGTQVSADAASLKTGGNLTIESAQHIVKDNSHDVSGNLGLTASKGNGAGGAEGVGGGTGGTQSGGQGGNAGGGNAQVNVALSKQDIDTNTNASINTRGGTTVNVGGNLKLQDANLNAQGGVSGQVAGNLDIETRADKVNVDQSNVNAYAGLGSVGSSGGGSKGQQVQEGVSTAANQAAQTGIFTNVNTTHKDDLTIGTASGISGGASGINLRVGGNTTLTGATNAASDFKTQGQTTIQGVATHQNDSGTSFRIAGTIASAAGSNDGSGGSYGLTVHTPHGQAAGEEDTPPNTPVGSRRNSLSGEEPPAGRALEPTEPESSSHHYAPANEPALGNDYANERHVTEDTVPPQAHAPTVEVPLGNDYANERRVANGTVPPQGHAPAIEVPLGSHYANERHVASDTVPPQGHAPTVEAPLGNGYANARLVGDENGAIQGHAPPINVPAGVSAGNEHHVAHEIASPEGHGPTVDDALGDAYGNVRRATDENGPQEGHAVTANVPAGYTSARGQGEPEGATSAHLETGAAPGNESHVANRESPLEGQHEPVAGQQRLNELIAQDPQANALRQQAAHLTMDPTERTQFERNLAEAVAFSQVYPEKRAELFAAIEDSVKGPIERGDGLWTYPVKPQYAGEAVEGFDNWKSRNSTAEPGAVYQTGESPRQVNYFTPEQQQKARVFVDPSGKLVFGDGTPLNGRLMFVVDADGHLIATRFPSRDDFIHHPSLSGGKRVLMAGELWSNEGTVRDIKDQSGHFRPTTDSFKSFLVALRNQGADLRGTVAPAIRYVSSGNQFHAETEVPNLLTEQDVVRSLGNDMLATMHLTPSQLREIAARAQERESQPAVVVREGAQAGPASGAEELDPYNTESGRRATGQAQAEEEIDPYNTERGQQANAGGEPHAGQEAPVQQDEPIQQEEAVQPVGPEPVIAAPVENRHAWTPETRAAVERLVTEDPQIRALHELGSRLSPNDRTYFDRNLAEIAAYTKTQSGALDRAELFKALKRSLEGPMVRPDGLKKFPLLPQYVGEDVRGFDNWALRKGQNREKAVPGSKYGPGRTPPSDRINYFTPEEQAEAQAFVHDGQLVNSKAERLPEGTYIFVVDQQKRLIASEPRAGWIHHSSLSAGQPVLAAGEMQIDANGNITRITNQSGHFRPDGTSFEQLLASLQQQGVDLSGTQAQEIKLTTAANGNFDIHLDETNLLDSQHRSQLRIGATSLLAPMGISAPLRPVAPPPPVAHPQSEPHEHHSAPGEGYGNQPTGWVLPEWFQRKRGVLSAERDQGWRLAA